MLAPGINVVYGANEAGKTTIKDFIVDMFYGIDKSRGIGARFDHYEKRKPINSVVVVRKLSDKFPNQIILILLIQFIQIIFFGTD